MKGKVIIAAVALAASSAAFAGSSPPPPKAGPMPGPEQTTDWLIIKGIDSFSHGVIRFCDKREEHWFLGRGKCIEKGHLTPKEALAKLGPAGAELLGVSPYITGYGDLDGIVIYYKRSESSEPSAKN